MHYEVDGTGRTAPVLLLHPLFHEGAHWRTRGYVEHLAQGRAVVVPDMPGHGRSSRPTNVEAYAAEEQVGALIELLDREGIATASVWGYSMGGWLACALAKYAPERFTTYVVGGWDPIGGFRTSVAEMVEAFGMDFEREDWFEMMFEGARRMPELRVGLSGLSDVETAALRASQLAFQPSTDFTEALRAVEGKNVLLYAGTDDPCHDAVRASAAQIGATFRSLDGDDHQTAWDGGPVPHVTDFLDATS